MSKIVRQEYINKDSLAMDTIRYYRLMDLISESDVSDMSEAHIINCVGIDSFKNPFRTLRPFGRRDEYMVYVTEGEVCYEAENGEITTLKPGMGMFLHSGHRQLMFSNSSFLSFHWIHFTGYQAQATLERFGYHHEFVFNIGINEKIISLFQKIFGEFISRKADFIYSSSLYLLQIFVEIERSLSYSATQRRNIEKSLTYIHSNYLNDISIEKLAEIEQISISHYRKKFIEVMNVPPKQYITSLRISYAANLLQYTNQPIKEIAVLCGYEDLGYFYRVFKKVTNITPTHCRSAKRNE